MGSSSKNLKQSFFPPSALARGRGKSLKSMGSIRVTAEKRTLIDPTNRMLETLRSKSEKEIGQNFTSMGSVKGSIVVQGTSIGKSKGCSVAYFDRNELASDNFDIIEDETSFRHENLDEMQETARSKPEKDIRKNFTSMGSAKGSIVVKGTSIGKSKGCSVAHSARNEIALDKNLVHPCIDLIKDETSFPHENLDVMQETVRSKPAKEKGQNFTSLNSVRGSVDKRKMIGNNKGLNSAASDQNGRGSTFQQRTSIRKSKGYSAVSFDTNVLAHNKNLRQPDFSQIEHDTAFPHDELEVMQHDLRSKSGSSEFEKVKKVRGPNLCKIVTGLKPGEKLRVTFYHNRVVGDHHALFSRHLGSLVRDRNMCPLRVHLWTYIEEANLEHMWGAVTEKFDSDDMNGHRYHVLKHMRRLWNNWRGSLHMNAKSKPLKELLKDVPQGVDMSDWECLVKEHFLTKKFKDEIQELLQVEPSLTYIEVVERCFGPQSKSHVVGFGGGITSKDLKGSSAATTALLDELKAS
uniref:Transposon protein, CACTA, En/Spm sub-class n=1 Tax=Solanum tuberosum TaxID=4113 RepID=M1DDV9_SOLTU